MSRRLLLATGTVLVALLPAASAFGDADTHSPNVSHVLNVPYEPRNGTAANGGTDIEFARVRGRQYAFAGSYRNGMQIFDITNPRQSRRVGLYDCGVTQGDVQVFRQKDEPGKLFATYTSDTVNDGTSTCNKEAEALGYDMRKSATAGKNGTFILDVTVPSRPRTIAFVPVAQGSHNMTVHPHGNYLYNSNSDLIVDEPMPEIEIFNISNPRKPAPAGTFKLDTLPGLGTVAHDITFSEDGTRAYVAALSHGEVLDTTNPAKPSKVSSYDDETINVWHQTDPVTVGDREFIIAEDEMYGAAGGPHCPSGGVHVFEVTGELEKAPVKVGYWNVGEARPTSTPTGRCTAHVLDIQDDEDMMTIAFYNGGVRVVDLAGLESASLASFGLGENGSPGAMREVGFYRFDGMDSWAVKAPFIEHDGDFFMYGNDQRRGFDVYRYEADAAPSADGGQFLTARQAAAKLSSATLSASALQGHAMHDVLAR